MNIGSRISVAVVLLVLLVASGLSQTPSPTPRGQVRTVSIPISIFTKQELKQDRLQEYVQLDRLIVKESGDEQQILSIRSIDEAPLAFAVLIQDDLGSEFNLQIAEIKKLLADFFPAPSLSTNTAWLALSILNSGMKIKPPVLKFAESVVANMLPPSGAMPNILSCLS